jgi:hypothetical protein
VPFKKTTRAVIGYLDKPEMDALLSGPDQRTSLAPQRDTQPATKFVNALGATLIIKY